MEELFTIFKAIKLVHKLSENDEPKSDGCKAIRESNYDGFVMWLENNKPGADEFYECARSEDLRFILRILGFDMSVDDINRTFLRAVHYKNKKVYELLMHHPNFVANYNEDEHIRCAARVGNLDLIHTLLSKSEVNPATNENTPLRFAIKNGHVDVAKVLLANPRVNLGNLHEAFEFACTKSRTEIIRIFLERSDTKVTRECITANQELDIARALVNHISFTPDATSFHLAIANNAVNVVKAFLEHPKIDPSAKESQCVRLCIKTSNIDMLKLLLSDKRVNPAAKGNRALQLAVACSSYPAVCLLMQDPRVVEAAKNS